METVPTQVPTAPIPPLPTGSILELPGRGTVFVRDSGGTSGQPVLLLLHGWLATADLNWGFSYATLAEHFRVVAFDQRGHGQGLKGGGRFAIGTCAHDGDAVLEALGIDQAIAVGYSMGGPIALELARRHPERVSGLVLCATAASFLPNPLARFGARSLSPLTRVPSLIPNSRLRQASRDRLVRRRATGPWQDWIASELGPSDPAALLAAGAAIAGFEAWRWIGELAMPGAVVVTTRDSLVRPVAQQALARALPDSSVHEVDGDHLVCFDDPERFAPTLIEACWSVDGRT